MLKTRRYRIVLLAAFALVGTGPGSAMLYGTAWGGNSAAPAPQRKPASQQQAAFSVPDFARTIIGAGEKSPVPKLPARPPSFSSEPLSDYDAKIYQSIFILQEEGKIAGADREITKLGDRRLMGYVLYQRYMHPDAYKSSFDELKQWMDFYSDLPCADKIYKLAVSRTPAGWKGTIQKPEAPAATASVHEPTMVGGKVYAAKKSRTAEQEKQAAQYKDEVLALAKAMEPAKALKKLQESGARSLVDAAEYDILQGSVAATFLYTGHKDRALELASASVKRSGRYVPAAGWIAGLVEWENENYSRAADYFEIPAESPYASGWTSGAASYWAARSHMRAGNVQEVSGWLRRAMKHPRTFYGLIATRALGQDFDFNWKGPTFTRDYYELLMRTKQGNRAIALVAAGQEDFAESELLRLRPEDDTTRNALLAYAGYARMPGLGMRLAGAFSGSEEGEYYDAVLYPVGPWKPEQGYKIDPALINAIARQESRFDPGAQSKSGAVGLMQLLPSTATAIAAESTLTDPQKNVEIAQRYLEDLLQSKGVDGDLVMLLVAYNAGPGNLAKWKKQFPVKDPLLFIEVIPSGETRAYVERVLSNYWIYRLRENLPTPSLDALASGKSAKYAAREGAPS